jgi:hypothetical protein
MALLMKLYKISKFLNFEGKGNKEKDSFFNHLIENLWSMGSKCLA